MLLGSHRTLLSCFSTFDCCMNLHGNLIQTISFFNQMYITYGSPRTILFNSLNATPSTTYFFPLDKKFFILCCNLLLFCLFCFKYILLIMLLQLSHFPPFIPLLPAHPLPPAFPLFSSCAWVIHISSLASTFPILFLTSLCLFSTYHLCYLFSVPFPPLSLPLPC